MADGAAARDRRCLATVATADFLPGALAMVSSFLRRHPRFGGDA